MLGNNDLPNGLTPTGRRLARSMQSMSQDAVLHGAAVDNKTTKAMYELEGRGRVADAELALNSAVLALAGRNEMMVAERLMQMAGGSLVKQQIVADRVNRLMQADDRSLNRHGF